ncbi:hypothetical protein SLA2020_427490 [Shorea laevis]
MEVSKAETEHKKTNVTQSQVEEPTRKPDAKDSDLTLTGDDFVIVPTEEPEKPAEAQNQDRSQGDVQTQGDETTNRMLSGSRKSVSWSPELVSESPSSDHNNVSAPNGSNPYVTRSPAPAPSSTSFKEKMEVMKDVLGRWGRKVGEATRKAEVLAGNTWQHLKTSPSLAEATMGRIAQGTKVLAEGGYENIFRQTFETAPDEKLQNSYACYLSTSAGPVMGVLYVSTAKLAYCSDSPLPYKNGSQTEWSYYKVLIPLHQLKAVNPSSSRANPAEKYIQVISVDSLEFWFMGFLNYEGAVNYLQEALRAHSLESV